MLEGMRVVSAAKLVSDIVMVMSFPFSSSQSHNKSTITRPCPVSPGMMPVSTRSPVTTLSDKDDVTLRNPG